VQTNSPFYFYFAAVLVYRALRHSAKKNKKATRSAIFFPPQNRAVRAP